MFIEDDARVVRAFGRPLRLRFGEPKILVAKTLAEARALFVPGVVTALFVDLHLPDGCGIDALETARTLDPGVPAFVITGYPLRKEWVLRLAALEVQRYDKPIDSEVLVVIASRAVAIRAHQRNKLEAGIRRLGLTEAENVIVSLLAQGKNVRSIALLTNHSESTIENQLASVREKLMVHSQAQILARVVDAILGLG